MPRGYRYVVVALVGFLAGPALAESKGGNEPVESSKARTSQGDQKPQQAYTDHAGVPSLAQRFVSNPEPANGRERENRDLAAQENTAAWGFWVVIAAFVQSVLSAIGILFIIRTLRQNDRSLSISESALAHSRQSVETDMRPWLDVSVVAERFEVGPLQISLGLVAAVKNIGKTPAQNVRFEAALYEFGPQAERRIISFFDNAHVEGETIFAKERTVLPQSQTIYRTVANRRFETPGFDPAEFLTFSLMVAINVTYDWTNAAKRAQTSSSFFCRRVLRTYDTEVLAPFNVSNNHVDGVDINVISYEYSKID